MNKKLGFIKGILDGESPFETAVKDALKYIDDNDGIDGVEYHVGLVDGKLFKIVIEPDHGNSFDYGVVTPDTMAYQLIYGINQ